MQNIVFISLSTYLVFVLDSSLAPVMKIGDYRPYFALAALVLLPTRLGGAAAVLVAAIWGLLADCLADARLGPDLVCFALCAFALGRMPAPRGQRSWLIWSAAAFAVTFFDLVASNGLRTFRVWQTADLAPLATRAAGSALYTAFVSVSVLMMLHVRTIRHTSLYSPLSPRERGRG